MSVSPHTAPQLSGDCHSHLNRVTCRALSRKVTSLRGSADPLLESEQVLLQGEPGQGVPAIIYWHGLDSIGRLYHPDNRAHVSVSPGFPRGVGFLGNPTSRGIRWTPAPRRRAVERLLRSLPLFCVGRRDLLSAGLLVGCTAGKSAFPARFTMPVLGQANNLRRLVPDDGGCASSCSFPYPTELDGIPGQAPGYHRLGPLQGLMVSRYPGAYASPLHRRGGNRTRTGVKLSRAIACAANPRLDVQPFLANESHAPAPARA